MRIYRFRDFSDLSGDGFGFHTDLYGFVRIIWVGEHTDSMSAIKKCQYWQIFNVELIIYGKKHYLRTVKSCQYWQKYNASNGDKERPVSTSLKFSNTTFLPFNTFFSDFQDYTKTISVLMPPNINHKPQRFMAIHKITAFNL